MQHEFMVFEKPDPASIAVRHYKLGVRDGEIWIENHGGEGMCISEESLFDMLDGYFKSEF